MLTKMTDNEYFDASGVSNSFLTKFDRSPAHAKVPIKKTKDMTLGSLTHDYILQKEIFFDQYAITPQDCQDGRKKNYKDFEKENNGKIIIKYNDFKCLEKIKENILNFNFGFRLIDILDDCFLEHACFIYDNEFDTLRKMKMDIYFPDYNLIIDLKKTENCQDFKKSVNCYKYYRQDAWYSETMELETGKDHKFIFLTFETVEPFGVMAHELTQEFKEYGRFQNHLSLQKFKMQDWDQKTEIYPPGINIIEKPAWMD